MVFRDGRFIYNSVFPVPVINHYLYHDDGKMARGSIAAEAKGC